MFDILGHDAEKVFHWRISRYLFQQKKEHASALDRHFANFHNNDVGRCTVCKQ